MSLDLAQEALERILSEIGSSRPPLVTEQDARFQLIDRILVEVLGWDRSTIATEPHTHSGFVDYLISQGGRGRLVVEAKRTSEPLVNTKLPRFGWYKVGGSALVGALPGLQQAKRYCSDTATLFSAVTNGTQWIGFWASRTDGQPPLDGKAAVFPSLDAVRHDFAAFYDLFSPEGLEGNLYQVRVHEAEGLEISHGETLHAILPEKEVFLKNKSELEHDLHVVFRRFFSTISGEDPEMLAKCFVESKESREADDNLEKITRNLINRVEVVDADGGGGLQQEIRAAVESQRGEFVLVIGNKGSGKTTFIDRFFRLVLSSSLRRRCLVLRVDLADSDGNPDTISHWLNGELKVELESALFEDAHPTYEELQGAFFHDYNRWRHGEHKYLYERDKNEFKERFGAWIASTVENDVVRYIQALMDSAVRQRKLMPCIVFDNTDHHRQEFQEAVFQFAQSLFRKTFTFIICPITDRTIWQLSKSGPLQSYESLAFYLPVPSTKDVLAKRIDFIKHKVGEEQEEGGNYFLSKGIRLRIRDIHAFAACVEDIFINEEYIGRVVGWLSNHDIRRSLRIAETIVTSPTIGVDGLVKAFVLKKEVRPKPRETKLALIRGDYTHFSQSASNFILNLFAIRPNGITSPLVRLSILRMLMDREAGATESSDAYLTIQDICNYMEPMGIRANLVRDHLQELLNFRIVEPYDPTLSEVRDELQVRITHAGKIHFEFAFADSEGAYLSEMALTTGIRDREFVDRQRAILKGGKMRYQDWERLRTAFMAYCLREDARIVSLPAAEGYEGQKLMRADLSDTWGVVAFEAGQGTLELAEED